VLRRRASSFTMTQRPHFILLGGFLGAGKTTAVVRLAEYLAGQGLRAGLITNDQGGQLVDTATVRNCGFEAEEVHGGCFCCRFDALIGATDRMSRMDPPDVFVAEAVGSCTDLAATVANPLRRLHRDRYTVAPLSIVVDAIQARRMLGLEPLCGFSQDVRYLFRKQLEEANIIVISKSDLVDVQLLEELRIGLAESFPWAQLAVVSLRDQLNLESWFQSLLFGEPAPRPLMELDYGRYADAEASLGWLNASVSVRAGASFDPDAFLLRLGVQIQSRLRAEEQAEIAHLKLSLQADGALEQGTAVVNLVRRDCAPEPGGRLDREISHGRMLVNLRAQTAPETLAAVLKESLARAAGVVLDLRTQLDGIECFRPAAPVPTYSRSFPSSHKGFPLD
jgi:G3E family GTPase